MIELKDHLYRIGIRNLAKRQMQITFGSGSWYTQTLPYRDEDVGIKYPMRVHKTRSMIKEDMDDNSLIECLSKLMEIVFKEVRAEVVSNTSSMDDYILMVKPDGLEMKVEGSVEVSESGATLLVKVEETTDKIRVDAYIRYRVVHSLEEKFI